MELRFHSPKTRNETSNAGPFHQVQHPRGATVVASVRGYSTWLGVFAGAVALSVAGAGAQDLTRPSSFSVLRGESRGSQSLGASQQYQFLGPETRNQENLQDPTEPEPFLDENQAIIDAVKEAGRDAVAPSGYVRSAPKEHYNFRVGPVFFRFGAGLRFEFNDNIDNASDDRESDLITTPQVYLNGHWPITKFNDLSLRVGFGYSAYLAHPELNSASQTFELAPGTEIAFKIKIKNVYVNFYERPSVGQDSSSLLTLGSGLLYTSFTNSMGVGIFWDLNDLRIQGGYQRTDSIPLSSQSSSGSADTDVGFLRRGVDSLFASATFRVTDETSLGVEGGASRITYGGDVQNDGLSYHVGSFAQTRLTKNLSFRVGAGAQIMTFDSGGRNQDSSDAQSPYVNLAVDHRINRFLRHSLSLGYETALGTTTNSVQTTYLNEQLTIEVNQSLTLSANAFYEIGEESGGPFADSIQRFGFGIFTGYSLSKKLRMDVFYQFVARNGGGGDNQNARIEGVDATAGDYYQNRVGVNFTYAF